MAKLDDLKASVADLSAAFAQMNSNHDAEIAAAVAAYQAKEQSQDSSAFDDAISNIRNMASQMRQSVATLNTTVSTIAPGDLSSGSTAAPGAGTNPVQTSQTATTDPTGTAAAGLTVANPPDGSFSTAAPGSTVDPSTGAPVAQAGSAAAPVTTAVPATDATTAANPNPAADAPAVPAEASEPQAPTSGGTGTGADEEAASGATGA